MTGRTATLARAAPTMIVVAGLLAGITAALSAVGELTTAGTDRYEVAIAPFAFMLLFAAVFGLYPRLRERTPRLAVAGALFAAAGALLAPLLGIVGLAALVGLFAGDLPIWALASHLLGRHAGQVGLILLSVAILRTGAYPRRIGWLLLGPATVMLLALVHIVVSGPAWLSPILVAANAAAMLALGYALRADHDPRTAERSPADSPA